MKDYVLNKDEQNIGFGWWIILFALPIFLTAIWGVANAYEKFENAIPGLFIIFGCALIGIFAPLNKKLKPSRNRKLAYDVIKMQVITGGIPIGFSIMGQVPFESVGKFYIGTLVMMVFSVIYIFFENRELSQRSK